jgi:hypothetical protein
LRARLDERANTPIGRLDGFGNLVDILGLDDGLEVVLEDLGEIVCVQLVIPFVYTTMSLTLKFRSTEVLQDLLPVWRVVVAAQVWLELATQNLQRRALANTVCTNQTQDLARTGQRQPVQLEAIRRVSMADLGLEVRGQVDDVDGVEGAFLRADTASDTEALGDEGDLGGAVDFDA